MTGPRPYSNRGTRLCTLKIPLNASVYNIVDDKATNSAIIDFATYSLPSTWLQYPDPCGESVETGIKATPSGNYSHLLVRNVLVPSLDNSVTIPLTIVSLGQLGRSGDRRTILTAYGAHEDIEGPRFMGSFLAWLERGGVWALAHVRGGGEKGESWYRSATRINKVRSADDLAACALWLEHRGISSRRHLGLLGNSTGALLMEMAVTRNPALYRAVVAESGLYDLLRRGPGGTPFSEPELGDAADGVQKTWLERESPYARIVQGKRYPLTFMSYGALDQVVNPMNTRKMIAKLEFADPSSIHILRVYNAEGHGANISYHDRIARRIDEMVFLEKAPYSRHCAHATG